MTTTLLILEADAPPREVIPGCDRLEIGRAPGAGIVLRDLTVSRRHAVVRRAGDDFLVEDEGSTYGTSVNGRALPAGHPTVLRDGDVLELGKVRVVFHREREPQPADVAFAAEANARLLLLEGDAVRRWAISGPATLIGSAPGCEVQLQDGLGPPEEALIRAEGGCFWLEPRCPSSPPHLDGGGTPITEPTVLPSGSVIGLRRAQGLFIHDPRDPSEDPLRGISLRSLRHRTAQRTGISSRRLREILRDREGSGLLMGEALVEKRVLTPLAWLSLCSALLQQRRRPWWRWLVTATMVLVALLPCGCMWVTGAAVGIAVATTSSGDGGNPAPKSPAAVELRGPFLPLEGIPVDVAVADFLAEPAGASGRVLDVAVIASDRNSIRFYRGDGAGRLRDDVVVPLGPDARFPSVLAVVPPAEGPGAGLVVATASSLEYLDLDAAAGVPILAQSIRLPFEKGLRDVEVGDFDGDGTVDLAVSSQENRSIDVYRGDLLEGALRFQPSGEMFLNSPRAIACANFDADPAEIFDLVVLAVEAGRPILKLFLSSGDGRTFALVDTREVADAKVETGASLEARPGATFEEGDPCPDVLLARDTIVSKLLVHRDPDGEVRLDHYPRPSGPPARRPVTPILTRLPRASAPERVLWDVVVGDAERDALTLSYSETDGLEVTGRRLYPVPGTPQALAAGDLNDDGFEDIVAVSVNPATLSLLLTHPAQEGVEDRPLFYPSAGTFGENRPQPATKERLVHGRADAVGETVFLASVGGAWQEVFVTFARVPEPGAPWEVLSRERHTVGERQFTELVVADFDGGADEILAVGEGGKLYLLHVEEREGPRMHFEEVLHLADEPGYPQDLSEDDLRVRMPVVAFLDDDPHHDLVIPVTVKGAENVRDHIAVILNFLGAREMTFYRTGDDPRRVCVANLDGDVHEGGSPALDILVACEGQSQDLGNRIDVLRGDASRVGRFLDGGNADGWIPGVPGRDEVEDLTTDNAVRGNSERARFILASSTKTVEVYFNRSLPGGLDVQGPCRVYDGLDPELVVLAHIWGPEGDTPDLLIGDEDAERILALKGIPGFDPDAFPDECRSPWEAGSCFIDGVRPDQFFLLSAGTRSILGCLTVDGEVALQERENAEEGCGFEWTATIQFEPPAVAGGRSGLACHPGGQQGLLLGSAVEDGDVAAGSAAVDLVDLGRTSTRDDVLSLGSLGSLIPSARLVLDGEPSAQAVLLGPFHEEEDGALDLLTYDPTTETISCHAGLADAAPGDSPFCPVDAAARWRLGGIGSLIGWRCVDLPDTPGAVLMATTEDVVLASLRTFDVLWSLCEDGHAGATSCGGGGPSIHDACWGLVSASRPSLRNLFVVVLTDGELSVHFIESGKKVVLAAGVPGLVGCGDLDGDRRDDIVLVDPTSASLRVFLGGGDESFRPPSEFLHGSSVEPVAVALLDANGDGRQDVCFGAREGDVYTFLGDGRFLDDAKSAVRIEPSFAGPGLESIFAADLDRDGKDEIIASTEVPGLVILSDRRPEDE